MEAQGQPPVLLLWQLHDPKIQTFCQLYISKTQNFQVTEFHLTELKLTIYLIIVIMVTGQYQTLFIHQKASFFSCIFL